METSRHKVLVRRPRWPVGAALACLFAQPAVADDPVVKLSLSWSITMAGNPLSTMLREAAPMSLEQLVAETIANHPGVVSKRSGVAEAEAGVDVAKSQYLPTPTLQVNQIGASNNGSSSGSTNGRTASLILSQPLWAAGRLDAGLDAAQARARSAEGSVVETQNTLALRVADIYQSYMASRLRFAAQRAAVERLEELDAMMRRRLDGGVSAPVDGELSMARLAQARSDLALEEANARTLLGQMIQLVGRHLSSSDVSITPPQQLPLESDEVLVDRLLANHPTILRAKADVEAAQSDAEQKRAALWPTLALQAERRTYTYNDAHTSALYPDTNQVYLTMQYQPGAGLSGAAAARAVEARVGALKDALEATRRDLVEALLADVERFRAARSRINEARSNESASREVLASYRRLFVAGKRGWLDVVNAARELTQAELTIADLSASLAVGAFRLKLRSGDMGWVQQ